MLERWDSDAGLAGLTTLPSGGGNAASRFKALEEWYPAEAKDLEEDGSESRGVAALLEAADMGGCRFIPEHYPEFDSVDAPQPDFQVLRLYLQGLLRRADKAMARSDAAEAERCYRAALVCGWHLTNDRPSALIYVTGLIFKLRGAQGYANFLVRTGRTAKAEEARRYVELQSALMRAFMWKANVALGEFAGFACLPAAVRIAASDAEAFWRKEAVVRLATLRYGVPDAAGGVVSRNPRYERAADEALEAAAAGDADPTVRRLAVWCALNVTPRDYGGMEHRFESSGR